MDKILEALTWFWETDIFHVGKTHLTLGELVIIVAAATAVLLGLSWLRRVLLKRIVKKLGVEIGPLYSLSVVLQYLIGTLALFAIVQSVGIDLSTLTVVFGALGIGIGFGLQSIISNFLAGIIILLERPVKVGDRVTVGDLEGDIIEISIRATTLLTNEGVAVIVPNNHFITQQVVNRSLQDRRIRFKLPVGVSYSSDPEHVREVLMKVAAEHSGVLKNPEPTVVFDQFGNSSLDFFLWVWTDRYIDKPHIFKSEMNFAIHKALKEADITVSFPQRDLHIGPEPVEVILRKTE